MLYSEPIKLHGELNIAIESVNLKEVMGEKPAERWHWTSYVRRKRVISITDALDSQGKTWERIYVYVEKF